MIHSKIFGTSQSARVQYFTTCANDRPLIAQFCGNDPDDMVNAATYLTQEASLCDGIDINLGCPQHVARRGAYGAYLQDWNQISRIVSALAKHIPLPLSAKIRLQTTLSNGNSHSDKHMKGDINRTLELIKMLYDEGVSTVCVHGRTRGQRGQFKGEADVEALTEIVYRAPKDLHIIVNGSFMNYDDVNRYLSEVPAAGVMVGEAAMTSLSVFGSKGDSLNSKDYLVMMAHVQSNLLQQVLSTEECISTILNASNWSSRIPLSPFRVITCESSSLSVATQRRLRGAIKAHNLHCAKTVLFSMHRHEIRSQSAAAITFRDGIVKSSSLAQLWSAIHKNELVNQKKILEYL